MNHYIMKFLNLIMLIFLFTHIYAQDDRVLVIDIHYDFFTRSDMNIPIGKMFYLRTLKY